MMHSSIHRFLQKVDESLKKFDIKLRPNASSGVWVSMLLPLAIIISMWKLPKESTEMYKLATIASFGIFITNLIVIYSIGKQNKLQVPTITLTSSLFTSFLFWICLKKSILYSVLSGFGITMGYAYLFPLCLHSFPLAFSFGESAFCTQTTALFIFSSVVNIFDIISKCDVPQTNSGIATTILQVGILGIFLIVTILYSCKKLQTSFGFYLTTILVVALGIIPMLHFLLDRSPVLWVLFFLTGSLSRIYVILFWIVCVALAIFCVSVQIYRGNRASTSLRKLFHILAVIIFLPGLLYECTLLYLATGVVLALFIIIEIIRKLNVPPLGPSLQMGFQIYVDEQDAGEVALTPIYLLAGCSIPLWLHPYPCDLTDSAGFQLLVLLSGILSIGIGDTMASVIGSNFGKHKWKGSKKSIEGTVSSIIFQVIFVAILMHLGFIMVSSAAILRSVFAIITNSMVEAKTNQVDNLILPIITYILLI